MKKFLFIIAVFLFLSACTQGSAGNNVVPSVDVVDDFVEEEPFFYCSYVDYDGISIPIFMNEFSFDKENTYLFYQNIGGFDGFSQIFPKKVYIDYYDNPGFYFLEDKTLNAFAVAAYEVVDDETRTVHVDVYNKGTGGLYQTIDATINSDSNKRIAAYYSRSVDERRIVAYSILEYTSGPNPKEEYFGERLVFSADGSNLISKEILEDSSSEYDEENDLSFLEFKQGKLSSEEISAILSNSSRINDENGYVSDCLSPSKIDNTEKVYIPKSVYEIKNYYIKENESSIDLIKTSENDLEKIKIDKNSMKVIEYALSEKSYSYSYDDNSIAVYFELPSKSGTFVYDLSEKTD